MYALRFSMRKSLIFVMFLTCKHNLQHYNNYVLKHYWFTHIALTATYIFCSRQGSQITQNYFNFSKKTSNYN